ncbi:MAG: CarD family transcriptional regulator [Veillonella parvula]
MFSKNELIIYNNEGVCRVDDICPLKEMTNSDRLYYKLSHLRKRLYLYTC